MKRQFFLVLLMLLAGLIVPVQAASGQVNLVVVVPPPSPSPSIAPSLAPSVQPSLSVPAQNADNPATGFAIAFDAERFFRQVGSTIQGLLSKLVFWR